MLCRLLVDLRMAISMHNMQHKKMVISGFVMPARRRRQYKSAVSIFVILLSIWQFRSLRTDFFQFRIKPLRQVVNPPSPNSSDILNNQLSRIRDHSNWKVLGNMNQTGEHLYEDFTEKTDEANIAFFIQISRSNLVLVPRLLSRIWHPRNVYCLHFDEKIQLHLVETFREALRENDKLQNVYSLPSTSITYAGVSMLVNTLDSMHSLLEKKNWDYYINLSGADYPLISISAIRKLLGLPSIRKRPINFIHYSTDIESWGKFARHRLGRLHFDHSLGFRSNHSLQLTETQVAHPLVEEGSLGFVVAKGEAWIIAHRTFCEQAAHGNTARRLLTLFANMQSPSEHFFQTLGWNHAQLNSTIARYSFRGIVWSLNGVRSQQHPYYVDVRGENGSWPLWPNLERSPNFFARKFETADSALMDHIDLLKSGASEKGFNFSSVANSFRIVKNRFMCVADVDRLANSRHIMDCFWGGWMHKGCKSGARALCVKDLPDPPQ